MKKESNAKYWIWLSQALGYNNRKIKGLCELYQDISTFVEGGVEEWKLSGLLRVSDIQKLKATDFRETEEILRKCKKYGYSVICIDEEEYPQCVYNIYAPPAVLYVAGTLPDVDHVLTIGIVGTRSASNYGLKNSFQIGYALSKYGVYTVSGGALGVDCASHRGTLAADGVTVCVLGCGINYNYLRENAGMRRAITKRGAVISEYPPDTPPKPYHFPARNRLIAALSQGVLIIESGKSSGSLITADFALEQGKELFALLGNNSPNNEGSNYRIKEGTAIPITDFMDIILAFRGRYHREEQKQPDIALMAEYEEIPVKNGKHIGKRQKGIKKAALDYTIDDLLDETPSPSEKRAKKQERKSEKTQEEIGGERQEEKSVETQEELPAPKKTEQIINVKLTGDESTVYQHLSGVPVHIDTIVKETGLPIFRVLSALTQLEMKGLTVSSKGRKFSLK